MIALSLLPVCAAVSCGGDRRADAIRELADVIESDFVYPDMGQAYASELRRRLEEGAYSELSNATEVAAAVTEDLQRVHQEGHLRLLAPDTAPGAASDPHRGTATGVGRAEWLSPGVAYVALHGFTGGEHELERVREVFDAYANASTLIIDARDYRGGTPMEGDVMFASMFEKPTPLLWMDVRSDVEERGGNPLTDGPTLKRIAGPEGIVRREWMAVPATRRSGLATARVYVLTSKETASAGEGFALALKRTGRATLIGETTAGAGHFGRTVTLPGGYRAFIPVGRPFDPDTGKGWEGTGVEPHVLVPAEEALEEALRRIGLPVPERE